MITAFSSRYQDFLFMILLNCIIQKYLFRFSTHSNAFITAFLGHPAGVSDIPLSEKHVTEEMIESCQRVDKEEILQNLSELKKTIADIEKILRYCD